MNQVYLDGLDDTFPKNFFRIFPSIFSLLTPIPKYERIKKKLVHGLMIMRRQVKDNASASNNHSHYHKQKIIIYFNHDILFKYNFA